MSRMSSLGIAVGLLAASASSCLPNYRFVECGDGTNPGVCIVSPTGTDPGSPTVITEYVGGMHGVPVQVVVSNFRLAGATMCGGLNNGCGHVHVEVFSPPAVGPGPEVRCDIPGHPYNTSGAVVNLEINLDACALFGNTGQVFGPHRIHVALFDDNHGAIAGASDATVFIEAVRPGPGP